MFFVPDPSVRGDRLLRSIGGKKFPQLGEVNTLKMPSNILKINGRPDTLQYIKGQLSIRNFGVGGTKESSVANILFQTGWHLGIKEAEKMMPASVGPKHFSD